ncbi:MAG: hypothetical protein LBJ67_13365 [Planctomycetaceae bacterium]|nr:hypothetical protein [Planctomycetaceae bacterium]
MNTMKNNACCSNDRAYCRSCCEQCFIDENESEEIKQEISSSMGVKQRLRAFYATLKDRMLLAFMQIVRLVLCLRN